MLSSSIIPPGEEGTIRAVVDTAGRHGRMKKTVSVHTDIPGSAPVRLTIEVHLVAG